MKEFFIKLKLKIFFINLFDTAGLQWVGVWYLKNSWLEHRLNNRNLAENILTVIAD